MRQITRGALRKGAYFGITSPQTSTPDMNTGGSAVPSSELGGDTASTASPVVSGTYSLRKRGSSSKLSSSNSVTGAQDDEAGLDEQQVVLPSQFPYSLKNCGAAKFKTGLRKDLPPPSRAEIELLCKFYDISVAGVDTSKLVASLLAKKRYAPPKKRINSFLSESESDRDDDDDSLAQPAVPPPARGGSRAKSSRAGGVRGGGAEHSDQCCGCPGTRTLARRGPRPPAPARSDCGTAACDKLQQRCPCGRAALVRR